MARFVESCKMRIAVVGVAQRRAVSVAVAARRAGATRKMRRAGDGLAGRAHERQVTHG